MANQMGLLNIFRSKKSEENIIEENNDMPLFDKKYKTIITCQYNNNYMEIVDWLNLNSKGSVDVKILTNSPPKMCIAFEDDSDALIFKIKYL